MKLKKFEPLEYCEIIIHIDFISFHNNSFDSFTPLFKISSFIFLRMNYYDQKGKCFLSKSCSSLNFFEIKERERVSFMS